MINYKDEIVVEIDESDHELILQELIKHLNKKEEGSISDYILDFCDINDYRIEEIAYLIKEHKELKTLLKEDCLFRGIFREEKKCDKVDIW